MEAQEIRAIARENLRGNWGISILTAALAAILGGLITGSGFSVDLDLDLDNMQHLPDFLAEMLKTYMSVSFLLAVARFIIGGTVQVGYAHYLLKQTSIQDFDLKDLFSQFHNFGQGFLQSLLRTLYVLLWSLLLIIPGIVKGYAYAMTPFIMAEHPELTANEAIEHSQEIMDGHKAELFWLELTFIGWEILNAFTLGIGSLFLNPYKNAAHAAFYNYISTRYARPPVSTNIPETE